MHVKDAIKIRRAYRSLDPVDITEDLITDLAIHAGLSASCFNSQPWHFVFVYDPEILKKLHGTLSKANKWVELASMIIVVFCHVEDDCRVKGRDYYLFDTGMATSFLILRATELGLVAHPIAGYDEAMVKEILSIPKKYQVITLVNVGKHSETVHAFLSEKQAKIEKKRPERLPLEKFAFINRYTLED